MLVNAAIYVFNAEANADDRMQFIGSIYCVWRGDDGSVRQPFFSAEAFTLFVTANSPPVAGALIVAQSDGMEHIVHRYGQDLRTSVAVEIGNLQALDAFANVDAPEEIPLE